MLQPLLRAARNILYVEPDTLMDDWKAQTENGVGHEIGTEQGDKLS